MEEKKLHLVVRITNPPCMIVFFGKDSQKNMGIRSSNQFPI